MLRLNHKIIILELFIIVGRFKSRVKCCLRTDLNNFFEFAQWGSIRRGRRIKTGFNFWLLQSVASFKSGQIWSSVNLFNLIGSNIHKFTWMTISNAKALIQMQSNGRIPLFDALEKLILRLRTSSEHRTTVNYVMLWTS